MWSWWKFVAVRIFNKNRWQAPIRTHGSRVIIPRSILRSHAQGVEEDSDDDVVEVDVNSSLRMPEDVSSRSGDGSSFGAARDVQGAAERREVLL